MLGNGGLVVQEVVAPERAAFALRLVGGRTIPQPVPSYVEVLPAADGCWIVRDFESVENAAGCKLCPFHACQLRRNGVCAVPARAGVALAEAALYRRAPEDGASGN